MIPKQRKNLGKFRFSVFIVSITGRLIFRSLVTALNLDHKTSKKFIFRIFFSKKYVYSIKDIYTN